MPAIHQQSIKVLPTCQPILLCKPMSTNCEHTGRIYKSVRFLCRLVGPLGDCDLIASMSDCVHAAEPNVIMMHDNLTHHSVPDKGANNANNAV